MPDFRTSVFDSDYVKANVNVKDGDRIRFNDAGREVNKNGKPALEMGVTIVRNGEAIATKILSVNKTNYEATSHVYSPVTEKWIGKEMAVSIIKARNPQTGNMVDAVLLINPVINPLDLSDEAEDAGAEAE